MATVLPVGLRAPSVGPVMKSYLKIGMIGNVKLGFRPARKTGRRELSELSPTLRLKPKVAFRSEADIFYAECL